MILVVLKTSGKLLKFPKAESLELDSGFYNLFDDFNVVVANILEEEVAAIAYEEFDHAS